MTNKGIAPPDPATEVGRFRFLIDDTEYTELDPPEAGQGSYEQFSDADIEAFLMMGDESVNRAMGYAYLRLASEAARESKTVKDFDLSVDLTKRSADLRAIAALWFDRADGEDADEFDIVDVFAIGRRDGHRMDPEAAMRRTPWL